MQCKVFSSSYALVKAYTPTYRDLQWTFIYIPTFHYYQWRFQLQWTFQHTLSALFAVNFIAFNINDYLLSVCCVGNKLFFRYYHLFSRWELQKTSHFSQGRRTTSKFYITTNDTFFRGKLLRKLWWWGWNPPKGIRPGEGCTS